MTYVVQRFTADLWEEGPKKTKKKKKKMEEKDKTGRSRDGGISLYSPRTGGCICTAFKFCYLL